MENKFLQADRIGRRMIFPVSGLLSEGGRHRGDLACRKKIFQLLPRFRIFLKSSFAESRINRIPEMRQNGLHI